MNSGVAQGLWGGCCCCCWWGRGVGGNLIGRGQQRMEKKSLSKIGENAVKQGKTPFPLGWDTCYVERAGLHTGMPRGFDRYLRLFHFTTFVFSILEFVTLVVAPTQARPCHRVLFVFSFSSAFSEHFYACLFWPLHRPVSDRAL